MEMVKANNVFAKAKKPILLSTGLKYDSEISSWLRT